MFAKLDDQYVNKAMIVRLTTYLDHSNGQGTMIRFMGGDTMFVRMTIDEVVKCLK